PRAPATECSAGQSTLRAATAPARQALRRRDRATPTPRRTTTATGTDARASSPHGRARRASKRGGPFLTASTDPEIDAGNVIARHLRTVGELGRLEPGASLELVAHDFVELRR